MLISYLKYYHRQFKKHNFRNTDHVKYVGYMSRNDIRKTFPRASISRTGLP